MLNGLNHITIAVSDVSRSFDFYVSTLGFIPKARWTNGAYLCLGNLWFCLSADSVASQDEYTHYAFSIRSEDFDAFANYLKSSGVTEWKTNKSEGKSIYFWTLMGTSWKFMMAIWIAVSASVGSILMKKWSFSRVVKLSVTMMF